MQQKKSGTLTSSFLKKLSLKAEKSKFSIIQRGQSNTLAYFTRPFPQIMTMWRSSEITNVFMYILVLSKYITAMIFLLAKS